MITPDRRHILRAGLSALFVPALTGCTPDPTSAVSEPVQGLTPGEQRIKGTIDGLPSFDRSVGSKATSIHVPGAEKLLIVVRYGHMNERAVSAAGPEAKAALFASALQVEEMLTTLVKHTGVDSLSGDGLVPDVADTRNRAMQFLHSTRNSLGELVGFRNSQEALAAFDRVITSQTSSPDDRDQATRVKALIERESTRLDRVLGQYHQAREVLERETQSEAVIKVALELGLKLHPLEDPQLHHKAYKAAIANATKEFDAISEAREDAILQAISQSPYPVTLLAMGAMHRFTDNVQKRSSGPLASRISLVEYTPAAFPDNIDDLLQLMRR